MNSADERRKELAGPAAMEVTMRIHWFRRVAFGLFLAIPLALLTYLAASADGLAQSAEPQNQDCGDCHQVTHEVWSDSAHAQSLSDPIFRQWWQERGRPSECLACHTTGYDADTETWVADGVTCEMCHQPVATNHPEQIMPTDVSSRLCGTCHLETHTMWQESGHAEEDLSCIRCHNPHTTDIRQADAQTLCSTCHQEKGETFHETFHAQAGLLCTDCHLQVSESQLPGEGHAVRSHTFTVGMETCATCHEAEMHDASSATADPCPTGYQLEYVRNDSSDSDEVATGIEVLPPNITAESEESGEDGATVEAVCVPILRGSFLPEAASQVQSHPDGIGAGWFAVVAALIGMGTGIVVAPWLESWARKPRRKSDDIQS